MKKKRNHWLSASTQHLTFILTTYYQLTIVTFILTSTQYKQVNLKPMYQHPSITCICFCFCLFVDIQLLKKAKVQAKKLIKQDYQLSRYESLYLKFYSDLVSKYNLQLGRMLTDVFYAYCQAIINYRIVYGFFVFSVYDKERTAVTSQQRMLNHP